jgi:hypothetical protein
MGGVSISWVRRSARLGHSTAIARTSAPAVGTRSPGTSRSAGRSYAGPATGYEVTRGAGPSVYQIRAGGPPSVSTGATSCPTSALTSVDLPARQGPATASRSGSASRFRWCSSQAADRGLSR